MKYTSIDDAVNASGLRLVIVKDMPSAWGVAAKAMIDYKGLDYLLAHQIPMSENPELLAWSGTNSGPVAAWNNESPINRWDDILFLIERLAPQKPLLPKAAAARIQVLGISHEICGELGFGWNRRLDMMRPPEGQPPSDFGKKYSYNDTDAALANKRVITLIKELATILKVQAQQDSKFLVGNSITPTYFYWASFSYLIVLQSQDEVPANPLQRPMFENTPAEITAAIDPILIEHRDRIMRTYCKLPLEL